MDEQSQSRTTKPCPECGGERVTCVGTPLFVVRRSIFSSHHSDTTALVCLNCGYTALYAVEPRNLKEKPKR